MSKAKRCDRCGKYYDHEPKNLPGTKTGPKYSINHYKNLGSMGAEVEVFDLCPECARQFTEWAENPDDVFLFKENSTGTTKPGYYTEQAEYNVYYNGQGTSDFDTLAGWFQEVYCKMLSLREANKQLREANEQLDDRNSKLKDENKKLKEALEFCQKEASSAREHAHNVEVNAERIRLGID